MPDTTTERSSPGLAAVREHQGPDIWCEDLVRIYSTEGVEVQALQGLNLVVDALLGVVPGIGDLLDVAHRANRKNLRLLVREIERQPLRESPSAAYVVGATRPASPVERRRIKRGDGHALAGSRSGASLGGSTKR